MSVTIYDVASLAHVSVTTISKILNHKDNDISAETRQRVLDVIKTLNFTPSGLARSLVTKKTNVIALLLPDISNQYFADMARGVEDGANLLGYNVILCNTDESAKKELEYLKILEERCIDGIILVPISENDDIFTGKFNIEKPYVLLDRIYKNPGDDICKIWFDNVKGGYMATKYLIDRGHRQIGIITGPKINKPSNDRVEGYKLALKEAGIRFNKSLVCKGDFKFQSGYKAARALAKKGVTAIFATNDLMASGAYKAIYELDLRVPDDISIVGYDNVNLSELLDPPLTTIAQPKVEMGKIAAKLLISKLNGEEADTEVVFDPQTVERKSVRVLI